MLKAAITIAISLTLGLSTNARARVQNGTRPAALSIIEAGLAPDGATPRYTIEASGADLRDVLAALLRKTNREFVINQDVTGPVSMVLRDKTLDDILAHLCRVARPPIVIQRGEMITVATVPPTATSHETDAVAAPAARLDGRPERAMAEPSGRTATIRTNYAPLAGQTLTLVQPVTLAIPDERPVALRAVLQQIEAQTRVPIRLDPRIPGDVGVAARFTDTPLSLVLESIGRTGALKWQFRPDGSVLVAPTDRMLLTVRGIPAWGSPSGVCPQCGRPVLSSWSYCPHDGRPLTSRSQGQRARPNSR